MKRSTPLRRKSKTPLKKLKDKLWKACSEYIKKRDKNRCITCGRPGEGPGIHAGHFIPDAAGGVLLRYEEANIFAQCFHCNVNLGGWGERYAQVLEERYGRAYVERLRQMRNQTTKWDESDYLAKIEYYQNKLKELNGS